MESILKEMGGWPVLEANWDNANNNFKWWEVVSKFRKFGYSAEYFLSFYIGTDLKDSNKKVINVRTSFIDLYIYKDIIILVIKILIWFTV